MDRYAVINEKNEVVNVIVWDGVSKWNPPEGHRVERNEDVGRGDIWLESIQDFVRPMKNLKLPEDEISIAQRKQHYQEAKSRLSSSIFFINDQGTVDI